MYFLFSLHGTKRDILPFLQIAKALQKAGHEIQFVVNEYCFELLHVHGGDKPGHWIVGDVPMRAV
jgi:UDP:flavonoid glycosyltransferase YjiC (YdhE family)